MIQRVRPYGREEVFPANTTLYIHGDRQADMFVMIDGSVDSFLPDVAGGQRIYSRHRNFDFTGEFNLLTAQGAVVEARTVTNSALLRISRKRLQHLMRAEGDIANMIVRAAIWRRIEIIKAPSSGFSSLDSQMMGRPLACSDFLLGTAYPHRIVGPSTADHEPRIQ